MKIYCAAVLLSTIVFHGSAVAQMAGADVQKAFTGKRISLSCSDGTQGSGAYRVTSGRGTISGTYTRPGTSQVKDTGTVRVEGDNLCLRFKLLGGGSENCFVVARTSARSFTFTVAGGLVQACTATIQ
jgi:hypothetical protein